jgi:hypothetical protein
VPTVGALEEKNYGYGFLATLDRSGVVEGK